MEDNYIRRERARKAQKKKLIEEMRAALPVYTLEEILQHKLPYSEALLTSLEDRGYTQCAQYIQYLLQFQDDLRKQAGPLSPVCARPQLRYSKDELKRLCDRLVEAETYHNDNNFTMECQVLLQTAVYFAFSGEAWWWLGEQLLIATLTMCEKYKFLGNMYEALSRYCYAKFLIETFKEYSSAMEQLTVARNLSNGTGWTTKIVFPLESDVLFLKVNYLLYICLIRDVESLMKTDYAIAGRIAVLARKRAAEACYPEGEITALMLKGLCQLSYNDTKGAVRTFTKAYYIQLKVGSPKGICESRIHMAKAHLLDGNNQLSLNTLLLLRQSAEDFNLPYYLAQAYRHLGEFFLNAGESPKATPLLGEALKILQEREYFKESEQVRNLEAISSGLELFPKYIELLSKTDKKDFLMKLIDWKDSREPFVDDDEDADTYSIHGIIQEGLEEMRGINEMGLIEDYSDEDKEEHKEEDSEEGKEEHEVKKHVMIADQPEIFNPSSETRK